MTATIEELIAQGHAKIEAEQTAYGQRRATEEQREEQERQARVVLFMADMAAALEPALVQHFVMPEDDGQPFDPGHECEARFSIPGCTTIAVYFYKAAKDEHYSTYVDPIKYYVSKPSYNQYGNCLSWDIEDWRDLSLALVWAQHYFGEFEQITAQIDARQADEERQERERQARKEALDRARDERNARRDAGREAMLDLIGADPIAFYLMRAFLEIQNDRAAMQEKLDSYNDVMAEVEAAHERSMEAQARRLQEAKREAEDARARETEARDDADAAKRKLEQAQRGQ